MALHGRDRLSDFSRRCALLRQTDVMNGFANRFMMVYSACIERVHKPQPTSIDIINEFARRIPLRA
jgi:hypothetical protein